jgi:hypothetical protein
MMVIGIDPGTATTGFGLVQEEEDGSLKVIDYGAIQTPPGIAMPERLLSLYERFASPSPRIRRGGEIIFSAQCDHGNQCRPGARSGSVSPGANETAGYGIHATGNQTSRGWFWGSRQDASATNGTGAVKNGGHPPAGRRRRRAGSSHLSPA